MSLYRKYRNRLGRIQRRLTNTERRSEVAQEYQQLAAQMGVKVRGRNIVDNYYDKKIKPNTILLLGLGHNVRGNLQYILNELNYSPDFEGYKVYVRTNEGIDATVKDYIRQNNWTRTATVLDGKQYSEMIETCQYLLTEVYFPENWVKKPGQTVINIWHGTPLKKLGLAKHFKNSQKNGNEQKNFINSEYMLYPNEYTRDNMLSSYKVASLLKGKVLMLGYPRSGGLLAASQSDLTELKAQLAPNGEHIYAYMPTFKDYLPDEVVVASSRELLTYLDENLRDDQILYVNLHHRVSAAMDYSSFHHIRQFPALVDSYTLLAATEALITDYSSVFFDYLTLGRQIILHVEDYEVYERQRGTYMNLMELPFDKAYNKEDVLAALNRGKTYDDTEARQQFCGYDSTENAKKLCQLFLGREEGLVLQPSPANDVRKTLVYSRSCQESPQTQLLYDLAASHQGEGEIYMGCDMVQVSKNTQSAFPLLFDLSVIGSNEEFPVSALSRTFRPLYEEGRITFKQLIRLMHFDYALAFRRMYGEAVFNKVVVYDCPNPDVMLAHLCSNVPEKALILPPEVLDAAENDRFFTEALAYSVPLCRQICVLREEDCARAAKLCGKKGKVQVISDAAALDGLL